MHYKYILVLMSLQYDSIYLEPGDKEYIKLYALLWYSLINIKWVTMFVFFTEPLKIVVFSLSPEAMCSSWVDPNVS